MAKADQEGAQNGAKQAAAAADGYPDDAFDGKRHRKINRVAHGMVGQDIQGAGQAGQQTGERKDRGLVKGRVVAQSQDAVFIVLNRGQDLSELGTNQQRAHEVARHQSGGHEINRRPNMFSGIEGCTEKHQARHIFDANNATRKALLVANREENGHEKRLRN